MKIGTHRPVISLRLALSLAVLFGLTVLLFYGSRQEASSANGASSAVLASLLSRPAKGALPTESFAQPSAPSLGLAMADFTGDALPDLATAKLEKLDSSSAHYWIEIRSTDGRHQLLRLTAPFGGLLIIPRDVSGDGSLDLVVRSARSRAPVAVFLNDGSGHFSRAETAAFASALHDGPAQFSFTALRNYLDAIPACTESHTAECPSGSLQYLREQKSRLLLARYLSASRSFLSFGSNRAPPSLS
jgi:hypothetical protein